jgi:hypothetical protein
VGGSMAFVVKEMYFKYYRTFFPETKYLGNYIEEVAAAKLHLVFKESFVTEGTDIYVKCIIDLKTFLPTDLSKSKNCKAEITFWVHQKQI